MDNDNELIPTLDIYIEDFRATVKEIDEAIFLARGHTKGKGYVLPDLPKRKISGLPNLAMAMFLPKTPMRSNSDATNIAQFPSTHECYIFSERGIMRMLKRIFFDPVRTGIADAHIKDMWLLSGIGIVRERVLFRQEWFPNSRLRTVDSLVRYAHVFGEDFFTDVSEIRKLSAKGRPSNEVLDVKVTQYLVMKALSRDYPKEEALALILGK